MKTLRNLLFVFAISLFSNNLKAQILNFDLQIKNVHLSNNNTTILLNGSDSLYFTLYNNGTDSFANTSGTMVLRFYMHVDTMVQNPTPFTYQLNAHDSFDLVIPAILGTGDSVQLRTLINFPPTIFTKFKDNEIVIWPKFQPQEATPNNNSARLFLYCAGYAAVENFEFNNHAIFAFPNPAKGKTTVFTNAFTDNYQYEIFDITGKLISQSLFIHANSFTIDFKNMNAHQGAYFVRIFNPKKSLVTKIIYAE